MRRSVALAVCLGVVLAVVVPQVAVASAHDHGLELVGFSILEDLAAQDKETRVRSGYLQIGAGIVVGVVTGFLLQPVIPDYALPAAIVVGAAVSVPGIIALNRPSASERAFERVLTHPEPEREQRSVLALRQLSDDAHERRIIRAIGYGASGLAGFAAAPLFATERTYYWGFYNLGMAAYTLFFPSREERAYNTYLSLTQPEESR